MGAFACVFVCVYIVYVNEQLLINLHVCLAFICTWPTCEICILSPLSDLSINAHRDAVRSFNQYMNMGERSEWVNYLTNLT